ncbi:hypothetical protein ABZZ80_42380 [Streptomyces sp. NPDC006356]
MQAYVGIDVHRRRSQIAVMDWPTLAAIREQRAVPRHRAQLVR